MLAEVDAVEFSLRKIVPRMLKNGMVIALQGAMDCVTLTGILCADFSGQ
jgi:hypothetical protein